MARTRIIKGRETFQPEMHRTPDDAHAADNLMIAALRLFPFLDGHEIHNLTDPLLT